MMQKERWKYREKRPESELRSLRNGRENAIRLREKEQRMQKERWKERWQRRRIKRRHRFDVKWID